MVGTLQNYGNRATHMYSHQSMSIKTIKTIKTTRPIDAMKQVIPIKNNFTYCNLKSLLMLFRTTPMKFICTRLLIMFASCGESHMSHLRQSIQSRQSNYPDLLTQ